MSKQKHMVGRRSSAVTPQSLLTDYECPAHCGHLQRSDNIISHLKKSAKFLNGKPCLEHCINDSERRHTQYFVDNNLIETSKITGEC